MKFTSVFILLSVNLRDLFACHLNTFKVAILRRQMCNFLGLELEESIFTRLSRFVLNI